jgi:hypothetical protein
MVSSTGVSVSKRWLVEQVYIVEVHAFEALVDARHEIFARPEVAVWAGPHVVSGLGRDEQFVAVGLEVVVDEPSHRLLGRPVRRAELVGEFKMGDAVVEGIVGDGSGALVGSTPPKLCQNPRLTFGSMTPECPQRRVEVLALS